MYDINVKFYDFSHVQIECEDSVLFELKDYFSFFADGYKFNPRYRYGSWSGKIYLLDNNGLLPYGLVSYIRKFANNMGYNVYIDPAITEQDPITREEFDKWLSSKKIYSGMSEITPYWYQADSVFEGIKNRRAILNLPTSAGKSLIQALLSRYYVENFEGKILIIVPTTNLVTQMIDDFCDYRLFKLHHLLGIKAGTNKDSDALIYVSTWQSATKQPKEWFEQFGMVINDEMHLSTGKSISSIINGLKNCMYKFGLSGSLKDGKANMMQYIGMFGNVFKPTSTIQLMEDGQVTKLKINSIFLRYPDNVCAAIKGKTYHEEIKFVTAVKKRNKWVGNLAVKLASKNENVFVMFKHAEHGKELYALIKETHEKVFFINGEINTKIRDALKKMAEKDSGIIFVASYGVFSTGISIKNLHHVIFAHGVKSKITVLQSIGRILRKHDSKHIATLWDLIDDLGVKPKSKNAKKKYVHLNYSLKHGLERIDRYAEEQFNYVIRTIEL